MNNEKLTELMRQKNSDFADAFPHTQVIGTDLSPIQPGWVPPNLSFEIDDATQPWTFRPDSVDYIHMRYLLGSITDWDALYREAYQTLTPGGWIEHYEAAPYLESDDGTVDENSAMGQWGKIFVAGSKVTGRSFTVVPDGVQKSGMEKAGFEDIQTWDFKVRFIREFSPSTGEMTGIENAYSVRSEVGRRTLS
jgi:SAM-dependent methyltransferase